MIVVKTVLFVCLLATLTSASWLSRKSSKDDKKGSKQSNVVVMQANPLQTPAEKPIESLQDLHDAATDKVVNKAESKLLKLQDKLGKKGQQSDALDELIKRANDANRQRSMLRAYLLAYGAAQVALSSMQFTKYFNPMFTIAMQVINFANKKLQRPLDRKYVNHRVSYNTLLKELQEHSKEFDGKIVQENDKVIITKKDGKKVILRVVDEPKEENLHLNAKINDLNGGLEMMSSAWQI